MENMNDFFDQLTNDAFLIARKCRKTNINKITSKSTVKSEENLLIEMVKNIDNFPAGAYILKNEILLGHAQSSKNIDLSRPSWFYSICSSYPGKFADSYWNLLNSATGGKYYFIGYNTKPLILLPFSDTPPPLIFVKRKLDVRCFIPVNPDPNKRRELIDHSPDQSRVWREGYTTPTDFALTAQKKFPNYDGMTNGDEVIIFPKAMEYVVFDLSKFREDQLEMVKNKLGYEWKENPMCKIEEQKRGIVCN